MGDPKDQRVTAPITNGAGQDVDVRATVRDLADSYARRSVRVLPVYEGGKRAGAVVEIVGIESDPMGDEAAEARAASARIELAAGFVRALVAAGIVS